jgi:phosphotransferase system HPr-like phosphotransfer protein
MKMGVVQGDEVTLFCDGPDEDAAMNALKELLIKGPVEAGEPA